MMTRAAAGWWGYRLGDAGRLAEGEAEAALDCSLEEGVGVAEVGAPPSPPWCHSRWCGRGCCCAPPITQSPEQKGAELRSSLAWRSSRWVVTVEHIEVEHKRELVKPQICPFRSWQEYML